jgi:hypothetical protein
VSSWHYPREYVDENGDCIRITIMIVSLLFMLAPVGSLTGACPANIPITKTAARIGDLPPEIQTDLRARIPDLSDSGGPFQEFDNGPGPFQRFVFARLVKNNWFILIEHGGLVYFVATLGYRAEGGRGYKRSPWHTFTGPPCAVIEAALNGVQAHGVVGP